MICELIFPGIYNKETGENNSCFLSAAITITGVISIL